MNSVKLTLNAALLICLATASQAFAETEEEATRRIMSRLQGYAQKASTACGAEQFSLKAGISVDAQIQSGEYDTRLIIPRAAQKAADALKGECSAKTLKALQQEWQQQQKRVMQHCSQDSYNYVADRVAAAKPKKSSVTRHINAEYDVTPSFNKRCGESQGSALAKEWLNLRILEQK